MSKQDRHEEILDIVGEHRIASQEDLRELLLTRGHDVTQATLSRDIRELRLVKVPDAEGVMYYKLPPEVWDQTPPLRRLLSTLFISAEGVGNLLVVKTMTGGAQPVASAIDWEEWPELLGTVAGDDSILLVVRSARLMPEIQKRLEDLAGLNGEDTD